MLPTSERRRGLVRVSEIVDTYEIIVSRSGVVEFLGRADDDWRLKDWVS